MQLLLEAEEKFGIEYARLNIGGIITEKSNGIQVLTAKQCKELYLDSETGGLWYRLDPGQAVIPVTGQLIYVAPAAIVQIAFCANAKQKG